MSGQLIEVAVENRRGCGLFFQPLQRALRGRFNLRDFPEPEAMRLTKAWPEAVPGQVIGLDLAAKTGYVRDPLHDADQAGNRARIAASGRSLPPERQDFANVDVPTWLYWLRRAADAGHVRVIKGALPERVEGKPKKQFVFQEHEDERDRVIKRQERTIATLTALLTASLPPAKQREFQEALARQDEEG